MKKSIKILLSIVVFIACLTTNAQQVSNLNDKTVQKTTNVYYVDVRGVQTKQICLIAENTIGNKEGVVSFKTVGFPSKYFVLKSSIPITEITLKSWLITLNLELIFFGEGTASLEQLIYNKNNNK